MADLSSAKAKLARADQHIQAAKQMMETYLRSDFYKLAARRQKERKDRYRVVIKRLDPVPPEIGLLIGDAAHNLRATLDHIAYAFAKPAAGKEKKVAFPLCSTAGEFTNRVNDWLPGVSSKVLAAVKRFQPYHGKKWSNTKTLGYIQAVDNWDKHRTMLITAVANTGAKFNISLRWPAPIAAHRVSAGRRLKLNAILARFQLGQHAGATQTEMNVVCEMACLPVFDVGMPKEIRNIAVFGLLDTASKFIRDDVIPTFEKLS